LPRHRRARHTFSSAAGGACRLSSGKRYSRILSDVPDYKTFLTVDELKDSSRRLAEEYPGRVSRITIGTSRNGEAIECLKIGEGRYRALMFGTPHPNEPVGSIMLDYLSMRLAKEEEPLGSLDFTWYLVKCADPDGTRLNEGWFKGPFTLINYIKNFYRPPHFQQVEWSFPIDYKTVRFNSPMPETKALMNIISKGTDFMFSLHNSAFGGVYFYVSEKAPELCTLYQTIPRDQDLPLKLGEPEVPYAEKLDEAVYLMPTTSGKYDYLERNTHKDPKTMINHGGSSFEYARQFSEVFALICEVPYFYDGRVCDSSQSDVTRRDAVLESIEISDRLNRFLKEKYEHIEDCLTVFSRFKESVIDNLKSYEDFNKAKRHWAEATLDPKLSATVAQKFDSYVTERFYRLLPYGMFNRMIQYELDHGDSLEKSKLRNVMESVEQQLQDEEKKLLDQLRYGVIPIRKLVRVQLEASLESAEYALKTRHRPLM